MEKSGFRTVYSDVQEFRDECEGAMSFAVDARRKRCGVDNGIDGEGNAKENGQVFVMARANSDTVQKRTGACNDNDAKKNKDEGREKERVSTMQWY